VFLNTDHFDDYTCNVTVKKGVGTSCESLQERQRPVVVGRREQKLWGRRSETANASASLSSTANML